MFGKTKRKWGAHHMLSIFKWLVYLLILAGIALIAYAYIGPPLGANFAPAMQEYRTPLTLDAD
ncbi:hypothetical protein PSAL_009180 [Pseudooceanicola algae]|uniref:Uncharacterized protein n=1 Tax=Pseudooceanicola algae TaxID=1537215 RepID=A0A418SEB2_9RHOB|nr:hypothetical protein PSAL_009180 [Pseudooceanicola algae]